MIHLDLDNWQEVTCTNHAHTIYRHVAKPRAFTKRTPMSNHTPLSGVLFTENFSVLWIYSFMLYDSGSLFLIFLPIPFGLSLISDIILVIWLCVRRDHIARRRIMLKEIGIFLVHLFEMILVGLVYTLFYKGPVNRMISGQAEAIGLSILLTPLSLFPLCVFVYMRYSFGTLPREDRREGNNRFDIQTAGGGLQTAPTSTRVSLPSDTAAHAPNFLSPSTADRANRCDSIVELTLQFSLLS